MFVVQVKTGTELATRFWLQRFRIKGLVPQENRMLRFGGKWHEKVYNLFSGYVFIDNPLTDHIYHLVLKCPEVIKVLRCGNAFSELSKQESEWISILTNNNEPLSASKISVADGNLKIENGVLKNFENAITKFDKHKRRATVAITVCGEKKLINLSITLAPSLK